MVGRRAKEIKDNLPLQGINGRNSSIGVLRNSRFDLKTLTTEQMILDLEQLTGSRIAADDMEPEEIAEQVELGVQFFKIRYSELIKRAYQIIIAGGRSNNHGPLVLSASHWLPQVAINTNGYPNINIGVSLGKNIKVYVHLLMVAVFDGRRPLLQYFESRRDNAMPRQEVSHLCHIKSCVNPKHLVIETQFRNKLRGNCWPFHHCIFDHGGRLCILHNEISQETCQLLCNPMLDHENKNTGFSLAQRMIQLQRQGQSFEGTIPPAENMIDLQAELLTSTDRLKKSEIDKKILYLNNHLEI